MDINRLINDSIQSVITEGAVDTVKNKWNEVQDNLSSGKAGEIVYDKLHPEKVNAGYEAAIKVAKKMAQERDSKIDIDDVKDKASSLSKKAMEAVEDNPKISAAVAAALAAGIGGLALRKRLKSAAK